MITRKDDIRILFELASKVYGQFFEELENLEINIKQKNNLWSLRFVWTDTGKYWCWGIERLIAPDELYNMRLRSDLIEIFAVNIASSIKRKEAKRIPVKPCSDDATS